MITIDEDRIVSDSTPHYATQATEDWWILSWLPGRVVNQNQALVGVLLSEELTADGHDATLHGWLDVWAHELGMTGAAVTTAVLAR